MQRLKDLKLDNQRVIVRVDFNVPMQNGMITDDSRIRASIPTIKYIIDNGGAVILLSHLGRPTEGQAEDQFSLRPVADRLADLINKPVHFIENWLDGFQCAPGEIALCENVRFCIGEKANDNNLAKRMASIGDIFVMDAFATAHRAQASTVGIAQYSKIAAAGPLLIKELTAIETAVAQPQHPVLAIIGGAKVSSKLSLLQQLITKVDQLIIGGGMANTFLAAKGFAIGNSLCEQELVPAAKQILQAAEQANKQILLPNDVVCCTQIEPAKGVSSKLLSEITSNDIIVDISQDTIHVYTAAIDNAKTIIWNGPVGIFENPQFATGTFALAKAVAQSDAYSLAGGGDTLAALKQAGVSKDISYLSTGGGAFLELIEGKTLPAVKELRCHRATDCAEQK